TEEVDVLVGEAEGGHDPLLIVSKDPVPVHDGHVGQGGGPRLGPQVGDVHPLAGDGPAHEGTVVVLSHHSGVGGRTPQPDGVDRHVHRVAAGIGVPGLVVEIDAVVPHGGQLAVLVHVVLLCSV